MCYPFASPPPIIFLLSLTNIPISKFIKRLNFPTIEKCVYYTVIFSTGKMLKDFFNITYLIIYSNGESDTFKNVSTYLFMLESPH